MADRKSQLAHLVGLAHGARHCFWRVVSFGASRSCPPVKERPHGRSRFLTVALFAAGVAAAFAAGGCRRAGPVEFRPNFDGRDPATISLLQREAIAEVLEEFFGTPDQPRLPEGVDLDLALLRAAAGPAVRLTDGAGGLAPLEARRGLYRQHCAVCHGITGDGAGPAALLQNPYPRDFRYGLFKYTSTVAGAKPTTEDLVRIVREGLPGTAMPSFRWLDEPVLDALVEYVKYLALRGESEQYIVRLVLDEDEPVPLNAISKQIILEDAVVPLAEAWSLPEQQPEQFVVTPPPPPVLESSSAGQWARSIRLGRSLYLTEGAEGVKCHGPQGAGDGEQNELYDDWNELKRGVTPEKTAELARWFPLPLQKLKPRDFRQGIFHGGNRPEELYLRIHIGIKGTPMPGVGPNLGNQGALAPEEIWHVVNYVRWLAGQTPAVSLSPPSAEGVAGTYAGGPAGAGQ